MAIFIPHIKGCNEDNTVYTWIKWSSDITQTPSISTKAYTSSTNQFEDNFTNLGQIITTGATNQKITQPIGISTLNAVQSINFNESQAQITSTANTWLLSIATNATANLIIETAQALTLKTNNSSAFLKIETSSASSSMADIIYYAPAHHFINGYVEIGNSNATKEEGCLYVQNICNALSFNATSDKRAKKDIKKVDFSALKVIEQLPVYTFSYKDMDALSIGLIAQEAKEASLGDSGFSLINHPNATGKEGDYMTIKESKLVYILWKAIQEQQEQINFLKEQVKDLSRK